MGAEHGDALDEIVGRAEWPMYAAAPPLPSLSSFYSSSHSILSLSLLSLLLSFYSRAAADSGPIYTKKCPPGFTVPLYGSAYWEGTYFVFVMPTTEATSESDSVAQAYDAARVEEHAGAGGEEREALTAEQAEAVRLYEQMG